MSLTPVITADQLSTPDVIANPYPYYRELRRHTPLDYMFLPAGTVAGIDGPIRAWALMN